MHRYEIIYYPSFYQYMNDIYDYVYYDLQNPYSAERLMIDVFRACRKLSIFPMGHAVKFIQNDIKYRFIHVKKYTIIYHVDEQSSTVYIDYIMYSRRNILKLLGDK